MSFALFPRRDASDTIRRDCFVAALLTMTMGYRVIASNAKQSRSLALWYELFLPIALPEKLVSSTFVN